MVRVGAQGIKGEVGDTGLVSLEKRRGRRRLSVVQTAWWEEAEKMEPYSSQW